MVAPEKQKEDAKRNKKQKEDEIRKQNEKQNEEDKLRKGGKDK
jgi:hypothetical protein